MASAVAEKGFKRICTSCGTRFYDLNKRPIICPACSAEFTGDIKVKSRRGRAATEDSAASQSAEAGSAKPSDAPAESGKNADDSKDENLVSLDELDDEEKSKSGREDDDIELDDDLEDIDNDDDIDDLDDVEDDIDVDLKKDREE